MSCPIASKATPWSTTYLGRVSKETTPSRCADKPEHKRAGRWSGSRSRKCSSVRLGTSRVAKPTRQGTRVPWPTLIQQQQPWPSSRGNRPASMPTHGATLRGGLALALTDSPWPRSKEQGSTLASHSAAQPDRQVAAYLGHAESAHLALPASSASRRRLVDGKSLSLPDHLLSNWALPSDGATIQ